MKARLRRIALLSGASLTSLRSGVKADTPATGPDILTLTAPDLVQQLRDKGAL